MSPWHRLSNQSVLLFNQYTRIMETIQIRPKFDDIKINKGSKCVYTKLHGGIEYKMTDESFVKFNMDFIKQTFSMAIALCSKPWQIESMMQMSGINGQLIS